MSRRPVWMPSCNGHANVHRRTGFGREDVTDKERHPRSTTPLCHPPSTLLHAYGLAQLEAAIHEADKLDFVDPERLLTLFDTLRDGLASVELRRVLDHRSFVLTDTKLERLCVPIARKAGLPKPLTRNRLERFRVDFF